MTSLPVLLLADPNEARRRSRRSALESEELVVQEASTGTEALESIKQKAPDAILIELGLADPDGLDVLRRLKADSAFTSPIIVSIPAPAPEERKTAALAESAEAYLLEPGGTQTDGDQERGQMELLAATVRSMIRLGRAERERSALSADLRSAQGEAELFAARLYHDIEEPLRAVTTFVQIVEERKVLTESEQGYATLVQAAATRVRALLRGFISYAQAGHGNRSRFGRVDLKSPATAAVQALRKRIEQSHATVSIEGAWPTVWGDFGQLQQVFDHLLRNAIDYIPAGTAPVISLRAEHGPEQDWTIAVSDNGSGIPADFQASIFLPFKRLHGREIPGAGLGLAIARKIVETHGGRIWVESRAGGGASFRFSIRAAEKGEEAAG